MDMIYDKYDKCFLIREDKNHKIWDGLSELIIHWLHQRIHFFQHSW
jgi:regulator of sigma D